MKRLFLPMLFIFTLLFLCSCSSSTLTQEDARKIVIDNGLNILNQKNCDFPGKPLELELKDVVIAKKNIRKNEASCDLEVSLFSRELEAVVYYRLDMKEKGDTWEITSLKNYKSYVVKPITPPKEEDVLKTLYMHYSDDYEFSFDQLIYNQGDDFGKFAVSFKKESNINTITGTLTIDFNFDYNTLSWNFDNLNEEMKHADSWSIEGQWRFKDSKNYYRINISHVNLQEETALVKLTVSEYESVIDTAAFQQDELVTITPTADSIQIEPVKVILPEGDEELLLNIKGDGLYFATSNTDGYIKANMDRYSLKEY